MSAADTRSRCRSVPTGRDFGRRDPPPSRTRAILVGRQPSSCWQAVSASPRLRAAAARRAARPARVLVDHQGHRDRDHRRRAGSRSSRPAAWAVGELLPYSDLDLMLLHDNMPTEVGRAGRRAAVVPVVGRQHSHRPQRADGARGAEGGRRGHRRGTGDARGAPHRRRRRTVVAADRRGASAVAHRNRVALRRTRRTHPGALAAQRPDRPPRRARPEVRPRRSARRATAQRAGDRAAGRRTTRTGPGQRRPVRSATRIWRCSTCAPNCTGYRAAAASCCWPSTPTRSAPRCASATDSTWRACSVDAARTISYYVDAGVRTAANALPRRGFAAFRRPVRRPLDEGVVEFGGEVVLARDARPGARPRADPAGGRGVGDHRAADGGVHAGPARRVRAGTAHPVAATGAQRPAGDARRRTRRRSPRSRRWTEPGCGAGCFRSGARCATFRRATSSTSGPWTGISSKPSRGQALSPPGCPARICWCSARCATTSARAAAATTASSAPSWRPRSAPGSGCGRRTSRCCPRSCATTCCCRTPRRAVTCRIPTTIAAVVDALDGDPRAARAAARAGRGRLAGDRPRRVGRLEGAR